MYFVLNGVNNDVVHAVSRVATAVCSTRRWSVPADGHRDVPCSCTPAPSCHHSDTASQLRHAAVAVSDGQCTWHGGCGTVWFVTTRVYPTRRCYPHCHLALDQQSDDWSVLGMRTFKHLIGWTITVGIGGARNGLWAKSPKMSLSSPPWNILVKNQEVNCAKCSNFDHFCSQTL